MLSAGVPSRNSRWWVTNVIHESSAGTLYPGVRSQLYVALDARYITQPNFDGLMSQAFELGNLLGGLRRSGERQRDLVRN